MVKGMSTKNNIQDYILNTARKDKIDLTIYLLNGVPLKGKVYSFDNFTIIIENEGKQQLIYKHAVSTSSINHGRRQGRAILASI